MRSKKAKLIVSLSVITVMLAGCATDNDASFQQDPNDRETPGLSRRDHKEIQVGEEIHREILSSFSVYTEPTANEYVREITQTIGKVSHRPGLPYQCTILFSDKIYATAAPGGRIYITTGFINILDNESELAGVLAHEVAEVQYHNPKYSGSKQALGAAETAAGLAAGFLGPYGMLALVGIAALNTMTTEKDLPQRVDMADKKGLCYMVRAGYDPQCYIDVLYKIIYADPNQVGLLVDYYNSRPVNADRLKHVNKVFRELKIENQTFDTHREKFLGSISSVKALYFDGSH
ncbi:MAG: M48 family metalloprotease [Candidatus Omnitrophica bacterium]|nr:M48 family metalloprotease [Candidatus Omnitrophota bacterium]